MTGTIGRYAFLLKRIAGKREPWTCRVMRGPDRVVTVTGRDPHDVIATAIGWIEEQEPPEITRHTWVPPTAAERRGER